MDIHGYHAITEELRDLIKTRLSVRAPTFAEAVRRAGRHLPAGARSAASDLIAAEARLSHPKLAARTDPEPITRAAEKIRAALNRQTPGARVGRERSMLAAEIGFRVAVVIGLAIAFMQWKGLG